MVFEKFANIFLRNISEIRSQRSTAAPKPHYSGRSEKYGALPAYSVPPSPLSAENSPYLVFSRSSRLPSGLLSSSRNITFDAQ